MILRTSNKEVVVGIYSYAPGRENAEEEGIRRAVTACSRKLPSRSETTIGNENVVARVYGYTSGLIPRSSAADAGNRGIATRC
jgi:hypothetical protein